MALRVEWKWRVILGVMIVALLGGGCIENPDLFQPRALPDAGEVDDVGDDAEVCEPQTIDCEVVGGCGLFEDGCGEQVDCGLCPGEERLALRPAEVVLEVGERVTLEAVWRGEDGDRPVDEALSWSSSDANVSVNAAGEVEALSVGEARVSAETEDGGGRAGAEVIVAASLATIALELDPARLHVGETRAVSALFYDTSGQPTAARELSWSSSDEAVLRVDSEGQVRGVSSGQATVSAAVGGVRAELEVEVYFAWRDVELGGAFSC